MRPSIRRALWSAPPIALLIGGVCLAWVSLGSDGYPVRGIDVRGDIHTDRWALFALEYARSADLPLARLVDGAAPDEVVDMSWYFWLAVGHGRVVLIDTGTDRFAEQPGGKLSTRWSIDRTRSVLDTLAAAGLGADDVTDVILTHRHWDHVGGLRHFDRATVHAHADEWEAVDRAGFDGVAAPIEATPATPLPDLVILEAGRHTAHHCVVELPCGGAPLVIGGDGAYLFRDMGDLRALQERAGHDRVLPGHDPEVFERFDSPHVGIARICP